MNPTLRTILAVAAATAACPASAEPPRAAAVLLLDDGSLLVGDARKEGDNYVLAGPAGDKLLPARRVRGLFAGKAEAFAAMKAKARLDDPAVRMQMARWCLSHGLTGEALAEAEEAVKLKPGYGEAEAFARNVKKLAGGPVVPPPSLAPAGAAEPAGDKVTDAAVPDYNPDSYPAFATKVSTILANACAGCHTTDKGGTFRLYRVPSGSKKGTAMNLAAVLKQLDRDNVAKSPLLVKAATPHGGSGDVPLRAKHAVAFETLELWARHALSAEGSAEPEPGSAPPAPSSPAAVAAKEPAFAAADGPKRLPPAVLPDAGQTPPAVVERPTFGQDKPPAKPATTADPDDPFDPELFNRQTPKKE